ncbi:ARL14 effector protein [Anopheles cruzii]|uniref:ARL14 effector protein n=1 Tax=Anopheles cruzii TaxID=68878 RepID=UPI0022EC6437|nr:ARL14 effector protein [Anopheles cruzii]
MDKPAETSDTSDTTTDSAMSTNVRNPPEHPETREPPQRRKSTYQRRNRLLDENSKFLADFDPGTSRREKRKLARTICLTAPKPQPVGKCNSLYNEKGRLRESQLDMCDCLDLDCPGCHFPCGACGSEKCGPHCRRNRRWAYEQIEHDSKSKVLVNTRLEKNKYTMAKK